MYFKLQGNLDRGTFKSRFGTKKACYQYLADFKWTDGYSCVKCGHDDYIKGKKPSSRKCRKCCYDESPTSDTLFHGLKFSIDTAFEMLFEICAGKKGASIIWFAEHFGVQQKTAWHFRQKVQQAI